MKPIKISIIILNYNSAQLTEKCLEKLYNHESHHPFEIIVVDNNSSQEGITNLTEKWQIKENISFILSPKNLGYGQGNELGLKIARGEYLLILNPDVEVFPRAIDTLVEFLDKNSDVGLVAPQLMYKDGTIQDSFRKFPKPLDILIKRTFLRKLKFFKKRLAHSLMWHKDPEKTEDIDWVVGACLLLRKEALKDIEYVFDKRFFLFFEDTDLCRRLWEKGWRVTYLPKAKATHYHERLSEGGIFDIFRKKTLRIHIASSFKYFFKYAFRSNPRNP